MKWMPWGKYAIRTETHSISKAMVRGAWIYTLWLLPDKCLGDFKSADAAKAALSGMSALQNKATTAATSTSQGVTNEQA